MAKHKEISVNKPIEGYQIKTVTLLFLLISSFETIACSCHMGDTKDKLKNSNNVFIGKVDSIKRLGINNMFGDEKIIVVFDILKTIKGRSGEITLNTAFNSSGCYGYWFKEPENYLVYTFQDNDRLNTMWCGGVISESESKSQYDKEFQDLIKLTK